MSPVSEHALAHRREAVRDLRLAALAAVAAVPCYLVLQTDVPGLWILLPIIALLLFSMGAFCLVLMAMATNSAYRLARRHSLTIG